MSMIEKVLIGIAVGDAYGAGVEFQDRDWIRKHVDFTKFVNARSRIQVENEKRKIFIENYHEWDYTDDTEMTIGLMKALISGEGFSESLLIEKWKGEYENGKQIKGYGRNGHGSMAWFYSGSKSIEEVRAFQKERTNPGNAPAMRSVPLGLLNESLINEYASINARATHPNTNAILSSQCVSWAAEYLLVKDGDPAKIIEYCFEKIDLNNEYRTYLIAVDQLGRYDDLKEEDFRVLCGRQPIEPPYFLSGIKGLPSDSKFTAGCVLYVLKNAKNAFDALKKSIWLGGDVDSVASITTGIMSGKTGLDSIPKYMLNKVEGIPYLKKMASEFNKIVA